MTKIDRILTGLDVPKFGAQDDEASLLLSTFKYLGLLAKRSVEKRSPGYIGWPLMMYAFSKRHKLPRPAERVLRKLMPSIGSFLDTYDRVPDAGKRCSILLRSWMAFRMIDDPIDGDSPIKLEPDKKIEFLKERLRRFEEEDWDNRVASDILCASALADAEALGIKPMLKEGLLQVLKSMEFDAKRITQAPKFIEREQLEEYYFKLDTEGTGLGMLAILDEDLPDSETRRLSAMISRAVRIYYDIRDLKKEVGQGLVNVPLEDANQFGISMEELVAFAKSETPLEMSPEPIRAWIQSQVREALQLLEASTALWGENAKYKVPTQTILRTQYYKSAKSYLDKLEKKIGGTHGARAGSALERMLIVPWRSAEAVFKAHRLCQDYAQKLEITDEELKRYFTKARNLALMYTGFSQRSTRTEAEGAGKAAFLSCAYDVSSDWRKEKAEDFQKIFADIVRTETPQLADMAIGLFERDIRGELKQDGLERGVVALEFIAQCMGVRDDLAKLNGGIENLGLLFQIVDDVLDLEEDEENRDTNCLLTENRNLYLKKLTEEFSDANVDRMFPGTSLLKVYIKKAVKKAHELAKSS